MPAYWQPTGAWKERFRKALDGVFTEPTMELLTSDFFPPEDLFSKIAAPGFGKTFQFRLHELIEHARMNDWLLDLVAAAHERRPRDPKLSAIAEELGLTLAGRLDNPTGDPLEAVVQDNAEFIDPAVFRTRLPLLEGQVCWVDVPGGGGTGFLVGPDLVLTNDHVIRPVLDGRARWQDMKCRFDYKQASDGTTLDRKKQTEVRLDAASPLVRSWPPSATDWNPALGDAAPEEIDCALLRLVEDLGNFPVAGGMGDPKVEPRKWIDANVKPKPLVAGNQVFLLQHPKGEPLRLSIGTITAFNGSGTRVRYDANSRDGSSGSPCFNADLQLIALHHAHDPSYPPQWNQAVPFGCVQSLWSAHGIVVPSP